MREDQLSKLMFFVGCAGLPWLWAVHLLYWYGKQTDERNPARMDDGDTTVQQNEGLLDGESIAAPPENPLDVELEEKKWVRRELVMLVFVVFAWITWIIVFQILRDFFPPGWLVRGEDEAEVTGW